MRKILIIGGALVLVAAASFVGVVAAQPSEVHVERSRVVAASPEDLWPQVSDLRAFVRWSPWTDRDPNQVSEFSDPSGGVGAWYTWTGNADVGRGRMSITGIEEGRRVLQDLEFIEPFPSRADVSITLAAVDGGTRVTWGFDTENGFVEKAFSLVFDMDAMLGPDFELGLERLSAIAETDARARAAAEAATAGPQPEVDAAEPPSAP